jgi:hypothetical protein
MISGQLVSRRSVLILSICMLAASTSAPLTVGSSAGEAKENRRRDNAPLNLPLVNPRIAVTKGKRLLKLYSDGRVVRT